MTGFLTIRAPSLLCLYVNAAETASFFRQLYTPADVLTIDFSDTENITAAAALALFAHVNMIQRSKENNGCFNFLCKKSPIYRKFFIKTGLLSALKAGNNFANDSRLFRFGCSDNYIGLRREILDKMTEKERRLIKIIPERAEMLQNFFSYSRTAFNEILLNVKNHAYPTSPGSNDRNGSFNHYADKAWWQMFWLVQSPNGIFLNVLVYDLGVGIPRSLSRHTEGYSNLFSVDQIKDESHFMDDALKEGVSRFRGGGRGNGLHKLVEIVSRFDGSAFFIYSGKGLIRGGKDDISSSVATTSLNGTLVEWTLRLSDTQEI